MCQQSEQPSITCPDCGMRSYHPDDIKWGYCGRCQAFTSNQAPPGEPVRKQSTPRKETP